MERHASALKAARQALRHRARNIAAIGRCRTEMKKLREMIAQKSKSAEFKKQVTDQLNVVQAVLSKAASKGMMKPGTSRRYISRLSTSVHKALSN